MPSKPIGLVFGTAAFGNYPPYDKDESVEAIFTILENNNVKILDSAKLYGKSEEVLGRLKAGERFTIDTKWPGSWADFGPSTKDSIIENAKDSIQKLGVKKVDIFYMHSPDSRVPIADTLAGVNEVYKLGLFARFGLSNYSTADVKAVHAHCKAQNYVLPTVYQGNYSAVTRHYETDLLPSLRELGIAFYAYSPMAGGFLTKTKQDIADGAGRFNKEALGGMYLAMYGKPALMEALAEWEAIAKDVGCSRADLAYRWVAYNSALKPQYGDAMILGARKPEQLEQGIKGIVNGGELPDSAVEKIQKIWELVKHEAPLDNFNR